MPVAAGANPRPLDSDQVALSSEVLRLELGFRTLQVQAELVLKNQGPATKLTVGFPCLEGGGDDVAGLDCRTPLEVRVQGVKQRPRLQQPAPTGSGYWTWSMELQAGEEQTVEVRYTTRLHNDRYPTPLAGLGAIYYRLVTGARWAGPIGKLEIDVALPVETVLHVAPAGYTRTPGHIHWSLTSYEPREDVVVSLHPLFTGPYLDVFLAKDEKMLAQSRSQGRFDRERLAVVAQRLRQSLDWTVEFAQEFRTLIAARHELPPTLPPDEVRRCTEESARLIEQEAALHGAR